MNKKDSLEFLPSNYRHEKIFLSRANLDNWHDLSKLTDSRINKIIHGDQLCTESRLKKIRVIAKLILELDISPAHAYILLHSGINSVKALSILDPYILEKKIGRLQRNLNIKMHTNITLKLLNNWITKAKQLDKVDLF